MSGDRRKPSHSIEVPLSTTPQHNSRKRPPSYAYDCNGDSCDEEEMNENNAAMILVTLSLSPKSPKNGEKWLGSSPGSSSASWSSGSSSPPLSDDGHNLGVNPNNDSASARIRTTSVSTSDEGIVVDFKEDAPRKKRSGKSKFVCTWKGCHMSELTKVKIERHIRVTHLGKRSRRATNDLDSDSYDSDSHEEEFYYTEVEDDDDDYKTPSPTSPPTLSHRDMARPPHEDPEYQRQFVGNFKQGRAAAQLQLQQQNIQYNNNGKIKNHNINTYQHTAYMGTTQQLQQLQNNNTSCIPTSPLTHHNYTWPPTTPSTVITTSVTNTSNFDSNSNNINTNNNNNHHSAAVANNYLVHHNHHQQQQQHQPSAGTTFIKHARASSRPSQSTAPYPSPTYIHQHHNYSSPAPISPNNSIAASASTTIIHHNSNSANNVLQQLSQQNVTVTTHHSNNQHQQQQLQQLQQQQQLASVTITPNYTHTRGVGGGGHHDTGHHQQHQQQQQQQQHRLQQSPIYTANHRLVATNVNSNSSNSSAITSAAAAAVSTSASGNTGHVHQQHVAVQHANKQTPNSPNRRTRGENKKCRKVYGMDRREMWCTQCRWKKACSRFGD